MKIQAAMLSIVMWLLFAIYLYGLYISAGISLWRLIERDYGGDNLKQSALDVLYTLALLQGVIFGYRETFANFKGSLVDAVSLQYDEPDLGVAVLQYLQEIRSGCAKNPSFAAGRNLVTFAVDLLESKSGDGYVRGLEILGALLRLPIMETSANSGDRRRRRVQLGQLVLIRQQLTASASFGHIVHRLLVTLGPRSPYNRRIRECAATIVLHVAGEILVEQFRRGIHCISSLLDPYGQCCLSHDRRRPAWLPEAYGRSTVLEPYEREWLMETWKSSRGCDQEHDRPDRLSPESDEKDDDHCKDMMFLGMLILGALAVDDVNRTAMANSRGLIAKLIAPVSLDLLHSVGHGAWSKIMSKSLQVMNLLVDAPGEAGTDLRHEMLGNKKAISAMEAILECDQCGEKLQMLAMEILAALAIVDSGKDCASREEFVQMLLCAFSDCSRGIGVRAAAAAEALVMLSSKMEGSAMIIMKANNNSVDNLVKILLDRDNIILFRVATAVILERLCANYTEDDECLQNLKGVMTKAMPKVLAEVLHCRPTGQELQTETEPRSIVAQETDIENPSDYLQDNDSLSSHVPNFNMKSQCIQFLLQLCVTICDKFTFSYQDLNQQFYATCHGVDKFSVWRKLKEIVETNNDPKVDSLRIAQHTTKMVISMMKNEGSYVDEDLQSLMQSLSLASKTMSDISTALCFSPVVITEERYFKSFVIWAH
ncbi:Os12g0449900 [Oryza sativa Japonica Group]|uniref:Os12g0449900 protein n=1 Tax=Oryza sativa subsp. japonica TaxID=39947 RepID=A0A0N7KTZ8_ORYSJ|nr:Os12g0449900 [Oryza sativa Japonica Group]